MDLFTYDAKTSINFLIHILFVLKKYFSLALVFNLSLDLRIFFVGTLISKNFDYLTSLMSSVVSLTNFILVV